MQPFQLLWDFTCDGSVISVATTPNFSSVCAATVGKTVYLLNGAGEMIWERKVDREAWAIALSQDSRYIAVGTASKTPADGTLFVFTREGIMLWSQRIGTPIWSVSLSADGGILAASTWGDNLLYLFERNGTKYIERSRTSIPGDGGLYGTELTPNGQICVTASYDSGLYLVEPEGKVRAYAEIPSGLYNVALASGQNAAFVGTRDGYIAVTSLDENMHPRCSPTISQRPLCGMSVTENGLLVACGSFDGRVIVANDQTGVLWDYQTKGEVWTTAISANGNYVCAGSGDHKIRMFQNMCDTASYQEILSLENVIRSSDHMDGNSSLAPLIQLYLKYRLAAYGYSRLEELLKTHPHDHIVKEELRNFLAEAVNIAPIDAESAYHLGNALANERDYFQAIRQFQQAAQSPHHRSQSHRRAAECFTELGLKAAATSAWRQSREQHLDTNARHILFMLARSYEDCGSWQEARRVYEMILSWDADFRNSWEKLEIARNFRSGGFTGKEAVTKDYTGSTTSLLGPDAPRSIDSSLSSVLKAREKELLISAGEQANVRDTVKDLLSDVVYSRGVNRYREHLSYDVQLFLKYEFGLPEDEMKKFLETVNAMPHFRGILQREQRAASLDVGSATGRYPLLLTRLGFNAWGIDIAEDAIKYSISKRGEEVECPKFIQGDVCELGKYIEDNIRFDVITCMMGTFDHIPRDNHELVVKTLADRLNPNGVLIISVWDVECPHLDYLSMYDEIQKEQIRSNSRTQDEMRFLFEAVNLRDVNMSPFCLLPQAAIYDLGIEQMDASDIEIAAQADLAARALFRDRHGEMFLAIGYK